MLVSHAQDLDTHAILGGNNIRTFGVAQTAEFFTVLSSTLYSNKPLAVIREVLCNAWDIHKVTKREHMPIVITLDEDSLTIRDFGTGIADDRIADIFCVYGNSTKANDAGQTGGFGLGSKAPFAYSDHFTGISYHNGLKTLYAFSRGSAKTAGVPDCRIMAQVPTTESGMEISIPIREKADVDVFDRIIRRLVRYGGMNVSLNGTKLAIDPAFIKMTEGFVLLEQAPTEYSDRRILVRYGDILYPIDAHEDYDTYRNNILKILGDIRSNYYIVFQAEPDTLSVTPSRESLSMTDRTIETLTSLMKKIPLLSSPEYQKIRSEYFSKVFDRELKEQGWKKFLNHSMPGRGYGNTSVGFFTAKGILETYTYVKAPYNDMDFFVQKLEKIVALKPADADMRLLSNLLQFAKKYPNLQGAVQRNWREHRTPYADFMSREYIGPLAKGLLKSEDLDPNNLYYSTNWKREVRTKDKDQKTISVLNTPASFDNRAVWINTIVICTSRPSVSDHRHLFVDQIPTSIGGHLCYQASRTKGNVDAAVAFFKKRGFTVVNLPELIAAENAKFAPVIDNTPKEPKIKGIPSVINLMPKGFPSGRFLLRGHMVTDSSRIEKPEYVFAPHCLSGSEFNHKFFQFGDDYARNVFTILGDQGGVCVNSRQMESYIKKGARDGYELLAERMKDEITTNSRILNQLAFRSAFEQGDRAYHFVSSMISIGEHSSTLQKAFGLPEKLQPEDLPYYELFQHLSNRRTYRFHLQDSMIKLVDDIVAALPKQQIAASLKKLVELRDKPMMDVISPSSFAEALRTASNNPQRKAELEAFFLLACEG